MYSHIITTSISQIGMISTLLRWQAMTPKARLGMLSNINQDRSSAQETKITTISPIIVVLIDTTLQDGSTSATRRIH